VTPGVTELPALDPALGLVLRGALVWLLLAAAWSKLRDPEAFREALRGYALLPSRAVAPAATALLAVEAGLALALAWPGSGPGPALGAAGLLAAYGAAIAANLARGRRAIDCGCGGPGGAQPLSGGLVVRNAALAGAACVAALPEGPRALGALDLASAGAALVVLALLYAGFDVALANAARLRGLRGAP